MSGIQEAQHFGLICHPRLIEEEKMQKLSYSPVNPKLLSTSCCGGEAVGGANRWRRHGSDGQQGGGADILGFLTSVSKVEEVVSKLNEIYLGSIFQEYGIKFRVLKVQMTIPQRVGISISSGGACTAGVQ